MGPTAPPTHQHKQSPKLSKEHRPFNQAVQCPVPLLNWKVRPPTRFTVLDRTSTRLSSLYCQCSCQATILLENRGLLQQAQAVITLQIQALKKQSNSWNGPIIFLHESIFQMQKTASEPRGDYFQTCRILCRETSWRVCRDLKSDCLTGN